MSERNSKLVFPLRGNNFEGALDEGVFRSAAGSDDFRSLLGPAQAPAQCCPQAPTEAAPEISRSQPASTPSEAAAAGMYEPPAPSLRPRTGRIAAAAAIAAVLLGGGVTLALLNKNKGSDNDSSDLHAGASQSMEHTGEDHQHSDEPASGTDAVPEESHNVFPTEPELPTVPWMTSELSTEEDTDPATDEPTSDEFTDPATDEPTSDEFTDPATDEPTSDEFTEPTTSEGGEEDFKELSPDVYQCLGNLQLTSKRSDYTATPDSGTKLSLIAETLDSLKADGHITYRTDDLSGEYLTFELRNGYQCAWGIGCVNDDSYTKFSEEAFNDAETRNSLRNGERILYFCESGCYILTKYDVYAVNNN